MDNKELLKWLEDFEQFTMAGLLVLFQRDREKHLGSWEVYRSALESTYSTALSCLSPDNIPNTRLALLLESLADLESSNDKDNRTSGPQLKVIKNDTTERQP